MSRRRPMAWRVVVPLALLVVLGSPGPAAAHGPAAGAHAGRAVSTRVSAVSPVVRDVVSDGTDDFQDELQRDRADVPFLAAAWRVHSGASGAAADHGPAQDAVTVESDGARLSGIARVLARGRGRGTP